MPGRLHFLPTLAIALLSFAADASAEDAQSAAKILDAYRSALGSPERIRTLEANSTFFSERERMSGVRSYWGENGAWMRRFRRTPEGMRTTSPIAAHSSSPGAPARDIARTIAVRARGSTRCARSPARSR